MNLKEMFPEFGEHISKEEGDKLFKKARDLENESIEVLKNTFSNNSELTEYFTKPCYGFVFSKEILQELLAKMDSDDHYLVLLTGAKDTGRRTTMAMVYKTCDDAICLDTAEFKGIRGKIGTQHPGILRLVMDTRVMPVRIRVNDMER